MHRLLAWIPGLRSTTLRRGGVLQRARDDECDVMAAGARAV